MDYMTTKDVGRITQGKHLPRKLIDHLHDLHLHECFSHACTEDCGSQGKNGASNAVRSCFFTVVICVTNLALPLSLCLWIFVLCTPVLMCAGAILMLRARTLRTCNRLMGDLGPLDWCRACHLHKHRPSSQRGL